MAEQDLSESIEQAASQPKRASNESGSVDAHSLRDRIMVDRYVKAGDSVKNKRRGLWISRALLPDARGN